MGIFQQIFGSCLSCCFGSPARRRRSYPDHYIPKVIKQSVSHSSQARSHSSRSQRFSSVTETPSYPNYSQSAWKATEHQVTKIEYPNYERKRHNGDSKRYTSGRTQQTSPASRVPTNTSEEPRKSTNTRRGEAAQQASHAKQQHQALHVNPPRTQVKSPPVTYYLRRFTSKLKTASKDTTFEPRSDIIYHSQWTVCSAIIIDKFGNYLPNSIQTVGLRSNFRVEFRDCKIEAGRLQFSMKCSETGNISISVLIGKSKFVKDLNVTFSPCSSTLSEMVLKKIELSNNMDQECVYEIGIVDVFGEPIPEDSCLLCELTVSPREMMVTKTVMYFRNGHKYCDITVQGTRSWSKSLVVLLNGKPISPATKFKVPSEERKKIALLFEKNKSALLARDQVPIDEFIDCLGSRMFIPLLTGNDDGEFVPYNESNCQMQDLPGGTGHQLVCQNATKSDILGADFAHINNIKRVLELKDYVEITESTDQANISINLRNVQSQLRPICKPVVQHLLRGLYYRKKASEAAKIRMEWKKRFTFLEPLSLRNSSSLILCKFFKDLFGGLMNEYNGEACNELFKFFNFQRDESEIDLHGLLVADEEKLEILKLDMLRGSLSDEEIDDLFRQCKTKTFKGLQKQCLKKRLLTGKMPCGDIEDFIQLCRDYIHDEYRLKHFENELLHRQENSSRVNKIIDGWRSESDEAIRKLEKKLENFDHEKAIVNNTPWLEIIVGAGLHSRKKNKQNIRPKVEKLLKERNLKFAAVNKGSLVVTFQTYNGPEPCFGEYYCKNCDRCWKSGTSYVGKYQECVNCKVNCWPVKQREKERVENYHREGSQPMKRQSGPHQESLCQRCQELGYPCNKDYDESDD